MLVTFELEEGLTVTFVTGGDVGPFLVTAGSVLQVHVLVEDHLLTVEVQEADSGLNRLRVYEVARQVSMDRAVALHTCLQVSYGLMFAIIGYRLVGPDVTLGVERLVAIAAAQELVQMLSVIGGPTQGQISDILEDLLGLGVSEGRRRLVQFLDRLPLLLAHLLHLYFYFTFNN